ncbi:hypothetical protein FHR32_001169 [Streptosporangium album]|uniref:Lipoprotein n=1 Tax=Streptosporangium album TaxID=47479 RepID=A0A7W7RRK3_9ACTN|nr:hypothetical protein [Streptosporangium album]MBB4936864.1 hypothetical protein [Streptosporangium album]
MKPAAVSALSTAVVTVAALAVGACSPPAPAGSAAARAAEPGAVLIAASPEGAVLLDPRTESFLGIARNGQRIWQDRTAYQRGSDAICLARCPDAVFSGTWDAAGPDPSPRQPTPTGTRPFSTTDSPIRRVLTARSPSDAVIAEGPADGVGRLRLVRPDGPSIQVPVPAAADVVWSENPARTAALAVARGPEDKSEALWFQRDRGGWRPLSGHLPAGPAWGACTAGHGELAVLVGAEPMLILRRARTVPIKTDLEMTGECAAGQAGAVVLARWKDDRGRPHTAIRGVGASGAQTWARDIPAEVQVRAEPSGERFVLVYDGTAELVDQRGRTTETHTGVLSAAYTEVAELVLLRDDYSVQWLTS